VAACAATAGFVVTATVDGIAWSRK